MSWTKSWETEDEDEDTRQNQKPRGADERRVCPDCGGSALSPYDDGGSCPHCFNGYVN